MNERHIPAAAHTWHALEADAVARILDSGRDGLSDAEAARRLAVHGPNRLTPPRRRGWVLRLLLHFHNILIYVLLGAAAMARR